MTSRCPPGPYPPVPMPTVHPGPGPRPVPMPNAIMPLGPKPVAPVFPFAEAQAALQAVDDLLDDVQQLGGQHQTLTHGLLGAGRFRGTARDTFQDNVSNAGDDLAPGSTAALTANRCWLVQAITAANALQDQYELDLAAWRAQAANQAPGLSV